MPLHYFFHLLQTNNLIDLYIQNEGHGYGKVMEKTDDKMFRIKYKNGKQELLTYQEIIENVTKPDKEGIELWTYNKVLDHRWGKGDLQGQVEVLIGWMSGERTWEPLKTIKKDDPITFKSIIELHLFVIKYYRTVSISFKKSSF